MRPAKDGGSRFGIVLNGDEVRDTQVVNNFIGFHTGEFNNLPVVASDPNLYGIVSLGAIDTTIRDNWISGNTVDGTNGSRVMSVEKSCADVTITGNTFRNGGRGSWINQPTNFVLSGNVFQNNTTKCERDPKRGRKTFVTVDELVSEATTTTKLAIVEPLIFIIDCCQYLVVLYAECQLASGYVGPRLDDVDV